MYKLEWDMRARWLFAAALAVVGLWAGWTVYTWPHVVQFVPSFAVAYSKGLGQEVVVQVVNQSGHPVDFCASLIGWFPNGTLAKLDDVCGRGEAKASAERIRKYAEAWKNATGEVGVIVLLTYVNGTTPDGNYTLARTAKSFTIQPGGVLRGESVRATIKVKGKPPTQPPKGGQAAALALQSPGQPALQSWPPGSIIQCFQGLNCYVWTLDTVYVSRTGANVPLVAARVSTGWEASLIYNVHVEISIAASSSNYIYFSGGAAITQIVGGVEVPRDYSADIFTLAISDSSFTLNSKMDMWPYQRGPGIVVVGFKGDYALARYKEQICYTSYDPPRTYCYPTGNYIILYVVRPVQPPSSYGEVLSLNSWVGDMFSRVSNYWDSRTEYGGPTVSVNSITTVSENFGTSILALAIPLIELPEDEPMVSIALTLAAGVGASRQVTALGTAYAVLTPPYKDNPRYNLYAVYYLPSVKFEYQGSYYPLPSLFVDVKVSVSTLDRGAEGTT